MTAGFYRLAGVLLVLALAGAFGWVRMHQPPEPQTLANGASLEWIDCWFPQSWWQPLHCGRFTTAAEPGFERRPFVLPVVYRAAPIWRRRDTPVLFLAGGPGAPTGLEAEDMPWWLEWFETTDWPHDVVLYDQRGVGRSEPAHECPEVLAQQRELLGRDVDSERWARLIRAAGERCHRRLLAEGVDFSRFDTRRNAADAFDLMQALGQGRWNLYGVSYGSRIALEMLRQRPEALRAVVLDSVYPPQVHPELTQPWLLARLLELIPRICDLVDGCDTAPERIEQSLTTSLARLREAPLTTEVTLGGESEPLKAVYNADDLLWLLFDSLYVWHFIPDLPAMLDELAAGRGGRRLRQMAQFSVSGLLESPISDAIAAAVDCRDAAPLRAAEYARERARYPRVASFTEHDFAAGFCRFWSTDHLDDRFRQPVRADVPVLLLAGEFDPVTPPDWAELAARTLPRASLIEFPQIGHGVLDSHECASELVRAFYERPEDTPRIGCLDRL